MKKKIRELEKKLIDANINKNEKLTIFTELSKLLVNSSSQKSIKYAKQALELAEKLNKRKRKMEILFDLGKIYQTKYDYHHALNYFETSKKIAIEMEEPENVIVNLINIGNIQKILGKFKKALTSFEEALKLSEIEKNRDHIADCFNSLGNVYKDISNFDKALEYHLKALKMREEDKNEKSIASSLHNIGIIYYKLKFTQKALDHFQRSIDLKKEIRAGKSMSASLIAIGNIYHDLEDYDKSSEYFLDAYKIYEEFNDIRGISFCYYNLGYLNEKKKNYRLALDYFLKSLKIREELGEKREIANSSQNIGYIYFQLGNIDKAVFYLKSALKLAKDIKIKEIMKECYYHLYEIYAAQKNYRKALEYHKLHIEQKDIIFNKDINKQISEMQIKYEIEKKEKETIIYRLKNVELANANRDLRKEIKKRKDAEKKLKLHEEQLEKLVNDRTLKLIENEQKLKNILESSPDAITVTDLDGRITECNQATLDLHGYDSEEELLGKNAFELIAPIDLERAKKNMITTLEKGNINNIKYKLLKKDGSEFDSELSAGVIKDPTGKIAALVANTKDITQRILMENALKESEKKYRTLVESLDEGIAIVDENENFTFVNRAVSNILGYSKEELLLSNLSELVSQEEFKKIKAQTQLRKAGKSSRYEVELIRKDGTPRFILLSASPIINKLGEYKGAFGIYSDITKRKKAEIELKNSEAKLQTIIDNMSDIVFQISLDGTIKYISPNVKELYGYDPDYLVGKNFKITTPRYELRQAVDAFRKSLSGKDVKNLIIDQKDNFGNIIPMEVNVKSVKENGKVIAVQCNMRNIEERKKAEEAFRESEAHFRSLLENAKDYVIYRLGKGTSPYRSKVIKVSPSLKNIAGIAEQDIYDFNKWFKVVHPDDLERIKAANMRGFSPPYKFDEIFRINHPVKGLCWLHIKSNGIVDTNNELKYVNGLITDVTKRKQAEEQIQKDLQEKNLLLQEVHHRVKNNMQVISSLLNLQASYIVDDNTKDALKQIDQRIRSMALIHQRLYETENYVSIDFDHYLKSLTIMLFRSYRIDPAKIELILDAKNIAFNINKAIPVALLVNELISNSIKHAFPGNRKGKIMVRMESKKDKYTLEVCDNGIGLPDNIDFKNPASLGIQLINALTIQLHGTLEVRKEKGACFFIKF